MSKVNDVRLIGNAGNDPKLVSQGDQTTIMSMSFATHEEFKNAQGVKEKRTDWHNVVAFGKVAELFIKYVKKGSQCLIIGRLQTRQYTDKAGNNRYHTEVVCEEVLFLGSPVKENS
jgi:single-strand DNA-binding protein